MKVTIQTPDDSRTTYYGVQDFQQGLPNRVQLFYPVESPWDEEVIKGTVIAAIDSTAIPPESPSVDAEETETEVVDRRGWG